MAKERSLTDVVLDYALYLPVGVATQLAEEVPKLASKGRAKTTSTFTVAGMLGRFAAAQMKAYADGLLGGRTAPAGAGGKSGTTGAGGKSGTTGAGSGEEQDASSLRVPADRRGASPGVGAAAGSRAAGARSRAAAAGPGASIEVDSLAIPGYDVLAASQVVQRLASLTPPELEAVRRYEAATRGRRTILHRIAQLEATSGPGAP